MHPQKEKQKGSLLVKNPVCSAQLQQSQHRSLFPVFLMTDSCAGKRMMATLYVHRLTHSDPNLISDEIKDKSTLTECNTQQNY